MSGGEKTRPGRRLSKELFRRCAELQPEDFQCLLLSEVALNRLGRKAEWVGLAVAGAADGSDVSLTYNAACVYALIGEKDAAIDLLEANVARGFGKRDWVEHDSDFDSLREDPRFVTLLAKLS